MSKRETILRAATKLFAHYSYDTVGIRDIAHEAGANSAMISYYFGGKSGLHAEIFSRFVQMVLDVSREQLGKANSTHELCDAMGRAFLESARQNRDVFLAGLRSMNRDLEGLCDEQERLRRESEKYITGFLARIGLKEKTPDTHRLIFGAVMGMLFSDYLLGGGANINDDKLLQRYAGTIIQVLQHGLPSLVE